MQEQLTDFIARHDERASQYLHALDEVMVQGDLLPQSSGMSVAAQELRTLLSDRNAFSRIRTYATSDAIADPLLKRQGEILHRCYLAHQLEPRLESGLNELETEIRQTLVEFKADLGAGPVNWAGLWKTFQSSQDVRMRRSGWLALGKLGDSLAPLLLDLAARRNRAARTQGYEDHGHLSAVLNGTQEFSIVNLLDHVVKGSAGKFSALRNDLDRDLCSLFNTKKGFLGPWHFQHPLRLLMPWHAETTEAPPKESATTAKAYLRRAGLPLPSESLQAMTSGERGGQRDGYQSLVDLARLLKPAAREILRTYGRSDVPESLRERPEPVLVNALWEILISDLAHPEILTSIFHMSTHDAARVQARFLERSRRETQVALRYGLALARFEDCLYRSPGQDVTSLWWELVHEALGISARDDGNRALWAVAPELLGPSGAWENQALGSIAAAQIMGSLPPAPLGDPILQNAETIEALKEQFIVPAPAHSFTSLLKRVSGQSINGVALAEKLQSTQPAT